ncbi:MAG: amidophosphoribosyltransferase [Flavobacteriales bacterium]|nr:amidophosphoribosyltransferase [Flavobacteriales bacterium]MBO71984.1 amidophosphoribosyltransferase [Flavobacteriales bacterium]|tara:strand:+ start:211 stop:2112 length:1902 start_codon:yes stop_codon:yes gene_type:complete
MSDPIKHECGIVMIRLRKPLEYYQKKYGTALYGLNKLYLLMEKQHNRGQDGAGVATIKLDVDPGNRYISRHRSNGSKPIKEIFDKINMKFWELSETQPEKLKDPEWLKANVSFVGELLLGHLRYGTFGGNNIEYCHPFLRQNNWKTRNLVLAGNFNLTNVDELFNLLLNLGQHPKEKSDTVTVLEKIGHFIDVENQELFERYKKEKLSNREISGLIGDHMNVPRVLKRASKEFDGGYVMCGLIGHGDAFALRDPAGIRPCHYYIDDEIVVVASERPAIQTALNVTFDQVKSLEPGTAMVIKKNGEISFNEINKPLHRKECSFERIYFSRGSDADIYKERKKLGKYLVPKVLNSVQHDFKNTVFSYIPNTAQASYYGMIAGLNDELTKQQTKQILALGNEMSEEKLKEIFSTTCRAEMVPIKDAKLRTFISQDSGRDDLVAHVYDSVYGVVNTGKDNLVLIDDSIVRGTTLKKSILRIMDRLKPKKIVIVSSAPQIRFPDCYGIDMAKLGDFIAFDAAIQLLKENNKSHIIKEVYDACIKQLGKPKEKVVNYVKKIYEPFTDEQISAKISEILKPEDLSAELEVIYNTVENLHKACPNHTGDWYFTGDYPTPGGNMVVNQAFTNYIEGKNIRAY